MAFGGRYMLLLMGIFSIYCGFVYNDFFSLGMTAFPTAWTYKTLPDGMLSKTATWSKASADVYPFGVDSMWHTSDNDLLFFNSLKMKLSVILGITQMTVGLFLKLSNALHFRSRIDLFCEVLPQLIFMISLFGYMIFLIVVKWCIDWTSPTDAPGPPPSLIDTLINIALKPGYIGDKMYDGQGGVQVVVLLTAFACVPIMIFAKPYFLSRVGAADHSGTGHGAAKSDSGEGDRVSLAGAGAGLGSAGSAHDAEHSGAAAKHDAHAHSFGELLIHQLIESIEFVLGSVSNTASYLRLWALSLAHSQLATVFWERALVPTIEAKSTVMVFVGFAVFFGITTAVLLIMDVLECFLHALRLHWVEFQNKFYKVRWYYADAAH